MSFEGLNPHQQAVASTFGKSIAVIAGAGSGKTQTMKERIAEAFSCRTSSDSLPTAKAHEVVINNIDEVLAITFTEAAAAELKDRIKGVLRESPNEALHKQALLVDDAWISTIHGMCSRLLKENAFTLGVDPSFEILADLQREQLLNDAINAELCKPEYQDLLRDYKQTSSGFDECASDYVKKLIEAQASSPDGFDSLIVAPQADMREALRSMIALAETSLVSSEVELKPQVVKPDFLTGSAFIEQATEALKSENVTADEAEKLYASLGAISPKKLTSKKMSAPQSIEGWVSPWARCGKDNLRTAAHECALNVRLAKSHEPLVLMIQAAKNAYAQFCKAKKEQGVLDNNDLLLHAYAALKDERIAALYRDKFSLVIVDEFQDTNQLQLDIIRTFTGQNDCRLCVVGDRMQSIYRFQGADVSVCDGHLATVGNDNILELSDNYRSHQEIIDFVDIAFAGSDYLQLRASRSEELVAKYGTPFDTHVEGPRVTVIEAQSESRVVKTTDARKLFAEEIARRFKRMHDGVGTSGASGASGVAGVASADGAAGAGSAVSAADGAAGVAGAGGAGEVASAGGATGVASVAGAPAAVRHSYGDMVILLNKMTHAQEYADALRAYGIPCAIVKGSMLKRSPEADMVMNLVDALADAGNTKRLFSVLQSDLFLLQTEDYLALANFKKPAEESSQTATSKASIANAISCYADALKAARLDEATCAVSPSPESILEGLPPRCVNAVRVLGRAFSLIGKVSMSELVRLVLLDSGWLARLSGVEGQSHGANALKLVRILANLEQAGHLAPADVACALRAHLEKTSEPPGSLSSQHNDFVRIMTIHASKGLSIPIVAIAETTYVPRPTKLRIEKSGHKNYVTLAPQADLHDDGTIFKTALDPDCIREVRQTLAAGTQKEFARTIEAAYQTKNPSLFMCAVEAFGESQELAELERKIYVAITRAAEAVILCVPNEIRAEEHNERLEEIGYKKTNKQTINITQLEGSLRGSLRKIHDAEKAIRAHACGWDYCVATPAWLCRWSETGELPPDFRGAHGVPEDKNGFDMSTLPAVSRAGLQTKAGGVSGVVQTTDNTAALLDGTKDSREAGALPVVDSPAQESQVSPLLQETFAMFAEPVAQRHTTYSYRHYDTHGVLSASALKAALHQQGDFSSAQSNLEAEEEISSLVVPITHAHGNATARGLALHSLCEWAAKHWQQGAGLAVPSTERVSLLCSAQDLTEADTRDVHAMLNAWLTSPVAVEMANATVLQPEVPFYVSLGDLNDSPYVSGISGDVSTLLAHALAACDGEDEPADMSEADAASASKANLVSASEAAPADTLEVSRLVTQQATASGPAAKEASPVKGECAPPVLTGFIDLLAYSGNAGKPAGQALVVDYKTGTSLTSSSKRRSAYCLQAMVYAYALLLQGFSGVNLKFVFVELCDKTGNPLVEEFPARGESYTNAQELREAIVKVAVSQTTTLHEHAE